MYSFSVLQNHLVLPLIPYSDHICLVPVAKPVYRSCLPDVCVCGERLAKAAKAAANNAKNYILVQQGSTPFISVCITEFDKEFNDNVSTLSKQLMIDKRCH